MNSFETRYTAHPGHIGGALKRAREKKGFTQQHCAELAGCSWQAISRHESRRSVAIESGLLERLAAVLGTTADALWKAAEREEKQQTRGHVDAGTRRKKKTWGD